MNDTINQNQIQTPPAFMATTRQKILFLSQGIDTNIYDKPSFASNALNAFSNMTKGIFSLTKKG